MSLIIRIEQYGQEPRTFSTSELCITVGEDSAGLLSLQNILAPIFSAFSWNGQYIIHPHQDALNLNGVNIEVDQLSQIEIGSSLSFSDYTFTFLPIPAEFTVQATLEEPLSFQKSNIFAEISVSILSTNRVLPLFVGANLTIGSSKSDAIQLDFDGIAANHIKVYQTTHGTEVIPFGGKFTINTGLNMTKEVQQETYICQEPTVIVLSPSLIELEIKQVNLVSNL
jgi:hypothetical protein